ncbi:hypothetical protein I302_107462 [Kwoniella bestiolae CBS 10118]|uniref:Uncharacterized protein n=1 Tax=Kwoniella bestiolae CBS 10118 TaxID=1296100 RepID=A0A1B9FYG7_9TREE|nr:hypothetical protein I302_06797 [Kwoniella bestiolae CBS 10118]OCF23813.1 hypothetical protein I302_06797 [Kwoniella bestiolae CBS 10118]
MSYPDNSANSVHSLLALLRSAQDGSSASEPVPPQSAPAGYSPIHPTTAAGSMPKPNIPSKRQLDDLLSSLNARPQPQTKADSPNKRNLIEPFGPVGETSTPSKSPYDPVQSPRRRESTDQTNTNHGRRESTSAATPPRKRRKPSERVDEEGYSFMSFSKALPILSEVLEDEEFKMELKKMKKEQDALERRLWARSEKVKAEHERSIQAEKEIAKIARKVIPSEKKEVWAKSLSSTLDTFYLQQCLPAIDGLASKHKQRLIELGVPGLEDGGEKSKERIKRIMELLEAGLEE